jgi:hypothetical protein
MNCQGCQKELGAVEALSWGVCLDCTKARHRAVVNGGRCKCGNKAVRSDDVMGEPNRVGSRTWVSCFRCLGTICQLS